MKLYEFAISHYCEKVRWTLDYKGISYQPHVLAPGPSAPRLYLLSGATMVPVLEDNGRRMNESADIIDYLEQHYQGESLYPADAGERRRALELAAEFDRHLGHDVRRVAYWYILPDAGKTRELLTTGLSGWYRRVYSAATRVMGKVIGKTYGIDESGFERSRQRVEETLAMIERERDGRDYLVGNTFSVADLTAAALLYPLFLPRQYPYPLIEADTPRLKELLQQMRTQPAIQWAGRMYERHRIPASSVNA